MRAVIYTRISHDTKDPDAERGLGVARQQEDCEGLCEKNGWTVVAVYSDNDVSAAGTKKARPRYDAMLADVRAGKADVIVAYSNSRLSRRPAEWLDLINLANSGKKIATFASGQHDLTTADGRAVAMTIAIWDAAEAERTGERVKRQKQQRLSQGLPPGSRYRTYGYNRDWTVNEAEAAVVREIFQRQASGESINSINRDLTTRGLETVSGKEWRFQVTARILDNPLYAGYVSDKGEIVGKSSVPVLISEGLYESASNRGKRGAWGSRKHLLSGIAVCDTCKTPMAGTKNGNRTVYACSRLQNGCGKVSIKSEWLDDLVNAYMSNRVMMDKFTGKRKEEPKEEKPDPVAAIDEQIEAARNAQLAGDLDLQDLMPMLKELRERRKVAVKQQSEAEEEQTAGYFAPIFEYDQADISIKRTIIQRYITAIFVRPGLKGSNKFSERRICALMADGYVAEGFQINVHDLRDPHYNAHETIKETRADLNPDLKPLTPASTLDDVRGTAPKR